MKDEFYQQLQGVTDIVARIDIVYLIGDMNAKMGQGNLRDSVMDKEGAGTVNMKGEFYADLWGNNAFVRGGRNFQHKRIHKTTWSQKTR